MPLNKGLLLTRTPRLSPGRHKGQLELSLDIDHKSRLMAAPEPPLSPPPLTSSIMQGKSGSSRMTGSQDQPCILGSMQSCHTAIVEDYFVEGHIPATAIQRLLEEQPAINGIALPGMPAGSPGWVASRGHASSSTPWNGARPPCPWKSSTLSPLSPPHEKTARRLSPVSGL